MVGPPQACHARPRAQVAFLEQFAQKVLELAVVGIFRWYEPNDSSLTDVHQVGERAWI